ncbi:hypothetical protein Pcinc_041805 [Petrolisthes cinctipes]|uniref:Uncharacterized protein n=1 Tax=Petrolisthes cinctipes TaxID=88211 RepID=A0AAE1BLB3_PETCI|nr:hypothetical protein Pcinc_041805 [Petrolisthes cinctipes]
MVEGIVLSIRVGCLLGWSRPQLPSDLLQFKVELPTPSHPGPPRPHHSTSPPPPLNLAHMTPIPSHTTTPRPYDTHLFQHDTHPSPHYPTPPI